MPPHVITRPGNWTVPYSIELGATDELTPSSVFAHFDGAAASGAFLPCVTYYTQDGLVFARAFPDDDVAAGASADVSWFPGLSKSPSAASAAGVTEITSTDGTITVTDPTGPTTDVATTRHTNAYGVYSNSAQSFPDATFTVVDYTTAINTGGWFTTTVVGGKHVITCAIAGLYCVNMQVSWLAAAAPTKTLSVILSNDLQTAIAVPIRNAGGFAIELCVSLMTWADVGDVIGCRVGHDFGSAQNVDVFTLVARVI